MLRKKKSSGRKNGEGRRQDSCQRDATQEVRHVEIAKGRQRWQGQEPQADHCDRPCGGKKEGAKAPAKKAA